MPYKLTRTSVLATLALLLLTAVTAVLLSSRSGGTPRIPQTTAAAPHANPSEPIRVAHAFTLTNAKVAAWAVVLKPARAFSRPSASARVLTMLPAMTSDKTQNIVLVVGGVVTASHAVWYRVRLAILPNNSVGWVPRAALGRLYTVHTHLYVDLATTTATLKRNGVTIFKTMIGVGRPASPTPHGQFYVRDKLTNFHDAFYGPVAFGTSARSATLTDWPNGGFIGVHGTDRPGILPGRVSHGCVRMPNASILTLARLMPVGTPVTIT
jgi:lipoprotein-anchoring transpeptidase ErfK/SrfK